MQNKKRIPVIMILFFVANQTLVGSAMPDQNQAQNEFMNLKYFSSQLYLKGFARAISGQIFDYHSPHPEVRSALLSRATDGTMAVEWETESLPSNYRKSYATFIWIAGLGSNIAEMKFDFFIDDEYSLTFTSSKEKNWTITGKKNVELSFKTMMVDQYTDLFGYMYLKVPVEMLTPGKPMKLRAAMPGLWFFRKASKHKWNFRMNSHC